VDRSYSIVASTMLLPASATRIIKDLGHTFGVDISDVFDSVSQELGVGRASAAFCPYSELKHTWRRTGRQMSFKISDYLKDAPPEVVDSLARYIVPMASGTASSESASQSYLAYIRSREFWAHNQALYLSRSRSLTIDPRGEHRDLKIVFDYVNSTYFNSKVRDPVLAWVSESPARRLGYYFEPLNLLAVNRVFDAERVPRYALEFVVFHELLHHIDAESGRRAKRVHHTKSFREQERRFSSYADAERWLGRLVVEHKRCRKRGGVPRA
jgi:hypothetical protein